MEEPEAENKLFREQFERKIREKHPEWSDEEVNWLVDAGELVKIIDEYETLLQDPSALPNKISQKFEEVKRKQENFWNKYN